MLTVDQSVLTFEQAQQWATWGMRHCGRGNCYVLLRPDDAYIWSYGEHIRALLNKGYKFIWNTADLDWQGPEAMWCWEEAYLKIMGRPDPLWKGSKVEGTYIGELNKLVGRTIRSVSFQDDHHDAEVTLYFDDDSTCFLGSDGGMTVNVTMANDKVVDHDKYEEAVRYCKYLSLHAPTESRLTQEQYDSLDRLTSARAAHFGDDFIAIRTGVEKKIVDLGVALNGGQAVDPEQ